MKLNKIGRNELRDRVDIKLDDVEFNPKSRIKLPIDVLDELLFDYSKDRKYKKIGFFSDNICKLDLSEISFENVSFNCEDKVNLSNTNGNYDFSKTFECIDHEKIIVRNINFENVDLSNNLIKYDSYFAHCNFCNTNFFPYNVDTEIIFRCCNLKNNHFSTMVPFTTDEDQDIAEDLFIAQYSFNTYFVDCNLSGTGVHINLKEDLSDKSKDKLNKLIKRGYLDGCYINEKKILSSEEKNNSNNELLREYKSFKTDRINNVIELINAQVSSNGGRVLNIKKNPEINDN